MAAKHLYVDLKRIISVFKIISNTERNQIKDLGETTNSFDKLLIQNIFQLQDALETDENSQHLAELKGYLRGLDFKSFLGDTKYERICESGKDASYSSNCEQYKDNSGSSETKIFRSSFDIRWVFCKVCLHALSMLKTILRDTKCSENTSPGVDLSVGDQQTVKTVIQLIVVLGISPNLCPGVGIPFEQRSSFTQVINFEEQSVRCPKCLYECVISFVSCLEEPSLSLLILSKHLGDLLASLMQLSYCQDVLKPFECNNELTGCSNIASDKVSTDASQLDCVSGSSYHVKVKNEESRQTNNQLSDSKIIAQDYSETKDFSVCKGGVLISKAQQEECRKLLMNIVSKIYQPLIIRELLFLQGNIKHHAVSADESTTNSATAKKMSVTKTPAWMKQICGHLLSRCLMKKNGVQNVLRAVLEGVSGSTSEWKVGEAIAQVIANCPVQVESSDEYYKSISPQILSLLNLPSSKLQQQYSRASILIIHAMMKKYPDLATKYVADPLMKPFLMATQQNADHLSHRRILANEKEMTQCIEGLHKVFVVFPNASDAMVENMKKIIVPLFEAFCFVRHGPSHVKTALQELLVTFLKRTDNATALVVLYVLACKELPDIGVMDKLLISEDLQEDSRIHSCPKVEVMAQQYSFGYGENASIILQRKDKTNEKENVFDEIFGKEDYQTSSLCLVEVLQNLKRDEIPGNFFLFLLKQVQEIIQKPDFKMRIKALVIFNTLAMMCEKLGPSVLKNTCHMIQFIDTTLTRAHHMYMESSDAVFELETLTMALGMLSALLGGAVKLESSDFVQLQGLTSILRDIAETHSNEEIKNQANDLLVLILTRKTVLSEKSRNTSGQVGSEAKEIGKKRQGSDKDFDAAFEQICDPLLPVRGHALMKLATFLNSRSATALGKVDILIKTFRDNLIHEDSYIYLAAVEGLVAAADLRPDDVMPYLAQEFMDFCDEGNSVTRVDDKGEFKVTSKAKEKHKIVKKSSVTRLKLGEALLRAVKRCGEIVPRYFQILIQAFLVGVRDEDSLIRASSLSNLGEICRLSPHMLSSVVHEIFHCVNLILRSDKANEVRQAAVLVLTLVFKGLGQKIITVLPDKLREIYELLKYVDSNDLDEKTRTHAQVALGELEVIMKDELFPVEKLVKHISVLR